MKPSENPVTIRGVTNFGDQTCNVTIGRFEQPEVIKKTVPQSDGPVRINPMESVGKASTTKREVVIMVWSGPDTKPDMSAHVVLPEEKVLDALSLLFEAERIQGKFVPKQGQTSARPLGPDENV